MGVHCREVVSRVETDSMAVIHDKMIAGDSSDSSSNKEGSMMDTSQRIKRKKKKRPQKGVVAANFDDLYKLTGETLGEGSSGRVETCKNVFTGMEYAVKIIEKIPGSFTRSKLLKEIEVYHLCKGHNNIIQLIEYFEEPKHFYLIFEKINGGSLLNHIQQRINFKEAEVRKIIKDLAEAIKHLHQQGIAHRDIKLDNVLCVNANSPCPVKLCDFDLCSEIRNDVSTPQLLTPVGSLEYMAPEVVDAFIIDDYDDDDEDYIGYNKKCDLWSLGIIMYVLLCGYAPFSGNCGNDCGWERGDSCTECQEMLFSSIKDGDVIFPEKHWKNISAQAKDLIVQLLLKDSSLRPDASQALQHPWIVHGGSTNTLPSPTNLKRQFNINNMEVFSNMVMSVKRCFTENNGLNTVPSTQEYSSFDLLPPSISTCSLLQRRRRRSKETLLKFSSIDELESDSFMKSI